jgi:hypothetical protein
MVTPSSTLRWKLTGAMSILSVTTLLYKILFFEFVDAKVSSNRSIELTWELSRKYRNIFIVGIDFWAPYCEYNS